MEEILLKVRTSTHSKPYELLRGVGEEEPKNFIYFNGEIYELKTPKNQNENKKQIFNP